MKERVKPEYVKEMKKRQDKDVIASLKMVGEGAPNYAGSEKEKEQLEDKNK